MGIFGLKCILTNPFFFIRIINDKKEKTEIVRRNCWFAFVIFGLCFFQSGAATAPNQKKGQRNIDLLTTVRRNLNDSEFYCHVAQAQAHDGATEVSNQSSYNSISALEALTAQNGFNFDPSVLGQASQQLAALSERRKNASFRTTEPQTFVQQEVAISRTPISSKPKKRRNSSRSKSDVDVENLPMQSANCALQVQSSANETNSFLHMPVNEKLTQRRPSHLSTKSVDEQQLVLEGTNDVQSSAPMSAKDLNLEQHVLPNRTEGPVSPSSVTKDHPPCISPTLKLSPALKGIQLYVPKLVITKIKQRRGSREVETHQVREVLPDSESDLQRSKKRRRSSEEKSRCNSSYNFEEGTGLLLVSSLFM